MMRMGSTCGTPDTLDRGGPSEKQEGQAQTPLYGTASTLFVRRDSPATAWRRRQMFRLDPGCGTLPYSPLRMWRVLMWAAALRWSGAQPWG